MVAVDAPDTVAMRTLGEIERAGTATLTPAVRAFLQGGSGSEVTLHRNRSAFDRLRFVPRVMSGLGRPSTATTVLGTPLRIPVLTAPFGADGYFHPEGHLAVARANERFGVAGIVPEAGTFSAERVAREAPRAAAIAQLHPMGTDDDVRRLVDRYVAAGYRALCVTVDCPAAGWREHNMLNDFDIDNSVVGGNHAPGTGVDIEQTFRHRHVQDEIGWTWDRLGRVAGESGLPWLAKGILTPEDACAALDVGASGVVVSNHGGRQLDGARSAIEALEPVAAAVGGRGTVLLDSGIRRGSDVIKAVALGADAVLIGRLTVYGLAAAGERGAHQVLELLRQEIETTLTLVGRGGIPDIDHAAVEWDPIS